MLAPGQLLKSCTGAAAASLHGEQYEGQLPPYLLPRHWPQTCSPLTNLSQQDPNPSLHFFRKGVKEEGQQAGKMDHYRSFLQTEIENKWQNLCLVCYYICAFIDLLSSTDYSWTVKGLHKTPLPLHKTTEVSCHFSTLLTEFMLSKRLGKCVRCKEHH